MINSDLQAIKNRLECPQCFGNDIDIYFINESSEEVDSSYVNENQELSEFAHICTCNTCGNEDDRCFFDHIEFNKWKITMHKFVQRKTLREHSEVIY